jgi:Outer membrane protein beta-barrel domain
METFITRHLLYLLWYKVTTFPKTLKISVLHVFIWSILLMASIHTASAQKVRGNTNYLDFQRKPYYFGITLGFNRSDYRVYRSKDFVLNDSFTKIESITSPGFNLGIVTNLRLGNYFDIRFLPTLSFADRNVTFTGLRNRPPKIVRVESVFVEAPFQFRYKSEPYRDKRLFVVAGVKYAFDVANNARARKQNDILKISATDYAIEYGAGVQFFFPFFIFSPEFKVSQGIGNGRIYNPELNQSTTLDKILSRSFTLSFHFEG